MKQARRRRNIAVTVRMNETEYADFISRVKESGLSQQAYMIRAVRGAAITTAEEIDVLKTISRTFADLERQLRGLATNVNQMAHVANKLADRLCIPALMAFFRQRKLWNCCLTCCVIIERRASGYGYQ